MKSILPRGIRCGLVLLIPLTLAGARPACGQQYADFGGFPAKPL